MRSLPKSKSTTRVKLVFGEETKEMSFAVGRSKTIEKLTYLLGLKSHDKYKLSKQGYLEYHFDGKLHRVEILGEETK